MASENYINHIALVLDASSSMGTHATNLIKVADSQIEYLAIRSKELDQETRVSVYVFANDVKCLIYDKDVLRLPSIKSLYRPWGWTALIDATLKSQEDLALTPEIYGEHSFLTFVLTDGMENTSRRRPQDLQNKLKSLPDHWTVAVLVPDQRSKREAMQFGFPKDNIAIWDVNSSQGINEAGDKIRQATENFMVNRQAGVRGSRSIFSTGAEAVNKQTVKANLSALSKADYTLLNVDAREEIRKWVQKQGHTYRIGGAYYQLSKTESIQPQKSVAVVEKKSGKVYTGPEARGLVGLPDMEVRVKPDENPDYDVFIQSTSVNRKLIPGTRLLLLK